DVVVDRENLYGEPQGRSGGQQVTGGNAAATFRNLLDLARQPAVTTDQHQICLPVDRETTSASAILCSSAHTGDGVPGLRSVQNYRQILLLGLPQLFFPRSSSRLNTLYRELAAQL